MPKRERLSDEQQQAIGREFQALTAIIELAWFASMAIFQKPQDILRRAARIIERPTPKKSKRKCLTNR